MRSSKEITSCLNEFVKVLNPMSSLNMYLTLYTIDVMLYFSYIGFILSDFAFLEECIPDFKYPLHLNIYLLFSNT